MYSEGFRQAAANVYSHVNSLRKTSKLVNVSFSSIQRWIQNGIRKKKKLYTQLQKKASDVQQVIRETILSDPFVTCSQLAYIVKERCGFQVSRQLVAIAIKRIGYSKIKCSRANARSPNENIQRIHSFLENLTKCLKDTGKSIVAIDECGFDLKMYPRKAYGVRGKRLNIFNPHAKSWKRIHMVAAVSICGRIEYQLSFNPIESTTFATFVDSLQFPRGTVVIMDNAAIHSTSNVKATFNNKEFIALHTPPYFPDANPIENMFAMLKCHTRREWGKFVIANGVENGKHASDIDDFLEILDVATRFCESHLDYTALFQRARKMTMETLWNSDVYKGTSMEHLSTLLWQ